jgi:hypothetical protein
VTLSRPTTSRPIASTVLLAVGGVVAVYNAAFVILVSAPIFTGCFGRGTCPHPAESVLALYWSLVGLVTVTAVVALVSAVLLYQRPVRHAVVGATTLGLSVASFVALAFSFPAALWLILLFLGGWSLLVIIVGGILALLWRPPAGHPIPPPPQVVQS